MRFLSLFSGIEAASVAWKSLGWRCVGVAEIDPFPCAVLAHHYPDVPNLGSVTDITDEQIAALGPIDVVVGGSPCQDLSVAGKRAGLAGERSGLFHEQLRIFHAARHLCGARFLLWENVPGAFSSHGGRDFAVVAGAMAGCRVPVPSDGWGTEGVVLGEHGLVEWAVLDAQWFGVAQRRRRVFAVLDVGDWAGRPPILLESDRLRGDSAPSREAGEGVARPIAAGSARGSGCRNDADAADNLIPAPHADLSPALKARDSKGPSSDGDGDGAILVPMVAPTLRAGGNRTGGDRPPGTDVDTCESLIVAHTLRGEGFDASEDGTGRGTPLVPVQPYTLAIRGRGDSHDLEYRQDGTANALLTPNGGRGGIGVGAIAFAIQAGALRTNPSSGPDGCGVQADHAYTIEARAEVQAVAFAHQAGGTQTTLGYDPELGTAPTLAKCQTPAVHAGMQVRRLTPVECSRLQGFPDDYLLQVPWRGKTPPPDGPMYKALGNSMAVPVMRWIGQQIMSAAA